LEIAPPPVLAGLRRRLASAFYELLLLTALILVATFPFVGLTGGKITLGSRVALQIYLFLLCGAYFVWLWHRGGQTLPMKTWAIRLEAAEGGQPSYLRLWARYALAVLGTALAGISFWWALLDRERQFLHDRLAGTRLVSAKPPARS